MMKLEAGTVTAIYRIPYKRKRQEGTALLIRPIYIGDKADLWEVKFTDNVPRGERRPWRWIWKDATAPDEKKVYEKKKGGKK